MQKTRQLIPAARRDDLVIQEVPGETLVYDLKSHRAHCLNQTAALVWRHCTGKQTAEEVARKLEMELGMPVSSEVVWLAVDRLEKLQLLDAPIIRAPGEARLSRRDVVRRLSITSAVVLLPLITSIRAPAAIQAASACIPAGNFGCKADADCCAGARCSLPAGLCFNP